MAQRQKILITAEKDFKEVRTEDLVAINQKIKDCELEIKKLSELLSSKGYGQAATYASASLITTFGPITFAKTAKISAKMISVIAFILPP